MINERTFKSISILKLIDSEPMQITLFHHTVVCVSIGLLNQSVAIAFPVFPLRPKCISITTSFYSIAFKNIILPLSNTCSTISILKKAKTISSAYFRALTPVETTICIILLANSMRVTQGEICKPSLFNIIKQNNGRSISLVLLIKISSYSTRSFTPVTFFLINIYIASINRMQFCLQQKSSFFCVCYLQLNVRLHGKSIVGNLGLVTFNFEDLFKKCMSGARSLMFISQRQSAFKSHIVSFHQHKLQFIICAR